LTTRLLVAPPASGKTKFCIDQIKKVKTDLPLAKVWVLVPDKLQAHAFQLRMANSGGSIGTQIGYFTNLLRSILEKNVVPPTLVSAPLVQRIVQETISDAVANEEIHYYTPLKLYPGFNLALRDVFSELKRAGINPETFQNAILDNPAHQDLSILYQNYQNKLQNLNLAESDDMTSQVLTLLNQNPGLASDIQLLIVDGFVSFSGIQKQALKLLSKQVGELLVTFPGAIQGVRQAHHGFNNSIRELTELLSPEVITLTNPTYLPSELQHIEKSLFEPDSIIAPANGNLQMLETRSPADEVREALRWIKKLVARKGVPLNECVIFTPSPSVYHPLIQATATEFGIPIQFTFDEPLSMSPMVASILNLLGLAEQNYKSRSLINVLRSPYFEFGIDFETIDTLEMISRVAQIIEGRDQWEDAFERLQGSSDQDKNDLDDERNAPKLPRGEQANQLRLKLNTIFEIISPPVGTKSLSDWISWLEKLLQDLHFYEKLAGDREISAYIAFQDIFQAFIFSETVMGTRNLDFRQFVLDLQGSIPKEKYRENDKTNQPELLIGTIPDARGTRYQAVVLLGLAEGMFPATEHPDPFLDEELRAKLGLESRLQREQASLFYQAVTRSNRYLLLTRPYLTENGEDWEESAFWSAIKSITPEGTRVRVHPDHLQAFADACSTQELLFTSTRTAHLPPLYEFLSDRWRILGEANEILSARKQKAPSGPYEGFPQDLATIFQSRFSSEFVWSPSRLETYGKCPFQFYVSKTLELEAREIPKLGMDGSQLGSLLHKILEETYLSVSDPQNLEEVLQSLSKTCQKEFATAPQKYGFRPSPLWEIEQEQFLEKLKTSVENLEADSPWFPFRFEARFGIGHQPPLAIDLDGERILVRGVIDRVDRNDQEQLRVIDYKTGGSFSNYDLTKGYNLQLPIYALAARDALNLGEPVEGMYWKILAGEGALKLGKYSYEELEGVPAAIQVVLLHLAHIINGIRHAEFPPVPPESGCPSYCPAASWCWRYQPGW